MKDEEMDNVIPHGLRDSLRGEPEEERRRIGRIWNLLGEVRPKDEAAVSTDAAWSELANQLEASNTEAEPIHHPGDRHPHKNDRPTHHTGRPEKLKGRRSESMDGRRHHGNARPHREDRHPHRPRRVLVGATIAAAAVALFGIWFIQPVTISVEPGSRGEVVLPDGSVVEINSATELRYARRFAVPVWSQGERRVFMTGEAFFRVEPAGIPFVVETADARIEALGTTFNVRSRPGELEGGTQVTLASGRIRVHAASDPEGAVILTDPGTGGVVTPAGRIHTSSFENAAPLEHVLAWRDRGFAAVDRPLDAILDEIEHRYGLTISPRTGVDPTERMSLFYLQGGTADQILRDVCLIQGCTYRETSRGFELSAPDTTL